ncbi:hypothetical protein DFJ58DRAFT_669916 [Suillus subalutaceus]|uniref:uncharacterized protein n=1 Tax=Suillus subalutaceus TaxID=48586 RepID=UPI001B85C598|nr:uncharacterized protein DFJ58DRAFT_669916 [Suillus subalutaceus]KAG1836175.1 hypothetical protein DFJ58DRAFT_669916 [Suillus subalutaceus]
MLQYALQHQKAIDTITQHRELGLRSFEMSDNKWCIVEQLQDVLKILKDAMLFFSRATPNLATVIPVMDLIDQTLATHTLNNKLLPSIHAAAGLAKKTLNRYYQFTDSSDVYRITMILHPRHKLSYFERANWGEDWIETALSLVRDKYSHSYSTSNNTEGETDEMVNLFENKSSSMVSHLFYSSTLTDPLL